MNVPTETARQAAWRLAASSEFTKAIQAAGLTPPEGINPDGKIHRFASNGRRDDDAGWYVFHDDGIPAGAFGCWRSGLSQTWRADIGRALTPAEEAAHQARVDAACRAREAEEARRHALAAARAAKLWDAADPARSDHPYLVRKLVRPVDALREIHASNAKDVLGYQPKVKDQPLAGRLLVVPIKVAEKLSTLELIDGDGRKSALRDGAKAGGYWAAQPLPEGDGTGLTLLIGEGVATSLSALEATGHPVVASLSSGNLLAVAKAMRERYPRAALAVLADLGNGKDKAEEAARATGSALVLPDFGPNPPDGLTDLNDMAALRGLEVVGECIAAQMAAHAGRHEATGGGEESASGEESRLNDVSTFIQSDDPEKPPRPRPQTDILIDIGQKVAQALFLGDDDRAYAVIRDTAEVWPIASRRFREWLRGCYFTRAGKGANANSLRDAVETISSKAQFSGDRRKVFLRTAEADGKIYIDLTGDAWRVVEIDRDGWRVLDHSPVMFTRRGSPAPLPVPEREGSLSDLWSLLNAPEKLRPLVAGWLLAALSPSGPYPILVLQGEEGTAKSTAALILRSLCDPSMVPLRPPTRDEKDFLVSAVGNWCVCIDNVSDLQPWLSDALCRLSTGGGFAARTLYTDCDETAIQIQRPVILNGIDVGAVRGDLISRTVTLTLDPIDEEERKDPDELVLALEKARPRILGALFTALSQAVRDKPNTTLAQKPRMAGFARLAVAAETALGFKAGEFMEAYRENLAEGVMGAIEASPVAQAIIEFMANRKDPSGCSEWEGTATELLDLLAPKDDDHSRSSSTWPKSGRGMTSALTRLAPALRRIGIHIEHHKTSDTKRTRLVRLTCNVPAQPSEPSDPTEPRRGADLRSDGSKASDDSTVREPGNRPKPSEKTSNQINGSDGSDGSDGHAGPFCTRGYAPPEGAPPHTLIHRVTMHTLDGRTIPEYCAEGRTLADWRKHSEIHGGGRPCRVEPA